MLYRKSFTVSDGVTKADDKTGMVTAIVSVTGNVDRQNDRIIPGAFKQFITKVKSGQSRWPAIVWSHQVDPPVIVGKTREMEELYPGDPRLPQSLQAKGFGGLQIKAQYNLDSQAGHDAYSNVKGGFVEEWSFMFLVDDHEQKGVVQDIKSIDPIFEFSNVLVGANEETVTLAAKSAMVAPAELWKATLHSLGMALKSETTIKSLADIADLVQQMHDYGKQMHDLACSLGAECTDAPAPESVSPAADATGTDASGNSRDYQDIDDLNPGDAAEQHIELLVDPMLIGHIQGAARRAARNIAR